MKTGLLWLFAIALVPLVALSQDWQDCKPDGSYSFKEINNAVHRVTSTHAYTGWDEKIFSRSGDLVSVAILQAFTDLELNSPETTQEVLTVLREAFVCPHRCISATSDRQPRVTLLLLEHLHQTASGKMRSNIEETRSFISQQASGVE
jgi:hypothetical protein